MKKHTILAAALLFILSSASSTHGQSVTLGDATFDATSDQTSPSWHLPMLNGVKNTFIGYGDREGLTKTEQFSLGETIAGVKTVRRHIEGSSPAVPTEDWWLAAGTNDDLRVLKLVRAGSVVFEASAGVTPPVFFPGTPADGKTWDLFGATMTIEVVALSFSGARLKVTQTQTLGLSAGLSATCDYYHAGSGLMLTETRSSSSGWRRQQ